MKIRNKLTLLFTAIIAMIMIAFAMVIYVSYAGNREEQYYILIRQQAITKANLLLGAKIAPGVLQLIYKNSENSLFQEEVAIYDTAFHLLYHDAVNIDKVKETRAMVGQIRQQSEIRFNQGTVQVVGFLYRYGNSRYIITAAAIDKAGLAKLKNLKYSLIISLFSATVLIFIAGSFFSKQALKPVSNLIDNVKTITATNLDLRVEEGNGRDEIAELAITFNQMLNRLEQSFDAQKEFVSNISHELRTPLAAMVAELDLAKAKERTLEEYKKVINLSLVDAKKLVRLSNGLLDLAKTNYDETEINFREVRLDEVLLDARQEVIKQNDYYKVHISFEDEIEDDHYISINGNEYLLKVAFMNLMENGCKFSAEKEVEVLIHYLKDKTILRFTDRGIGITESDLSRIFNSFFRGNNKDYAEGNGIGLSLTYKIVQLHKGTIYVNSRINRGTAFTIELPHI